MTKTAGAGQIPISHSWENRWKPPDGSVILSAMARTCKTLHPTWKAISQDLPPVLWTYVCPPTEEAAPGTRLRAMLPNPMTSQLTICRGLYGAGQRMWDGMWDEMWEIGSANGMQKGCVMG